MEFGEGLVNTGITNTQRTTGTSFGSSVGFSNYTANAPKKIAGIMAEFKPLHEVEIEGIGKVWVGEDMKLYRKTNSLMGAVVPLEPAKDEKNKTRFYVDRVKWEDFPPLGELRYINETLLQKYNREVMFLIGKKFDGTGFLYLVPQQGGTTGGVSWEDKAAAEYLAGQAEFIGTVHSHPSESAHPSCIDTDDWEKPEKSGLHAIFGRKGQYSISGAVAGHTTMLIKEQLSDDVLPIKVDVDLMGKTLEELLREPVIQTNYRSNSFNYKGYKHRGGRKGKKNRQKHGGFDWKNWEKDRELFQRPYLLDGAGKDDTYVDDVEIIMEDVEAFVLNETEANNLFSMRHNKRTYLFTLAQWQEAKMYAKACDVNLPRPSQVMRHRKDQPGVILTPDGGEVV